MCSVCSVCVCVSVFLLYVCMCVRANAWPFSQRINRSSVAEVTGEIRDWLWPPPQPSSFIIHYGRARPPVHVRQYTRHMCTRIRSRVGDRQEHDKRDRRVIKKIQMKNLLKHCHFFKAWQFHLAAFFCGYFNLLYNYLHTLRMIN